MNSTPPRHVTGLRGRVVEATYASGSKSERNAVFIETSDQRYLLRRKSGPVFGDTELDQYIGHEIECDGFVSGTTLLTNRIARV